MRKVAITVADGLGRAHAALLADLEKLEDATRPASGARLTELRARLGRTRTHILAHFQYEEQNGYMDLIRKREPHLERAIQQLAEEHRQLAETLAALTTQMRADTRIGSPLRGAIRAWIERVRQHEA